MKSKTLAAKLALSESDFEAIRLAVQEEEKKTTGEIAVAAIAESSDYSFQELFASVLLGAIAFSALLPFHACLVRFLDRLFWHLPDWYITAFYGIASFGVIAVFFLVANIPAIDRFLIPRVTRVKSVYNRAIRHFAESGVYATKDRTGILVFVSCMEHEVRIIADSGISEKIPQGEWDRIATLLASGIKNKKTGTAIVEAIHSCGKLLSEHFPAKKINPNELPDGLVILEAER